MTTCEDMYERVCKAGFDAIEEKLDRLDEALRGNSKPGIQLRLDRLETAQAVRSRLMWIITGATVTLALSAVWKLVIGG